MKKLENILLFIHPLKPFSCNLSDRGLQVTNIQNSMSQKIYITKKGYLNKNVSHWEVCSLLCTSSLVVHAPASMHRSMEETSLWF